MTETNPMWLLLAVVFLILLAVAIFVATLAYLQRGQSKKKHQPTSRDARPGEVMRVVRDQQTGQVLVEINGQQYAHIREIKDAQVGRRVLWAIADLLRFTGGMAANPQAVRSVSQGAAPPSLPAEQPTPAMATPDPGSEPFAPAATLLTSRAHGREAISTPDQTPKTTDIGRTITDFFRRGFQPPPAIQPTGSFVDEIDQILQKHLQRHPVPLSCGVHVRTGRDGSLQIEVGANTYPSPNDVPDPDIRELIKSAVAEWERR